MGKSRVLQSQVGCRESELCIAVGVANLLWGNAKGCRVEVWNLSGNARWQRAGIEVGDTSDTRATRDTGVPEVLFSNTIWSHYPKSSDHYSPLHKFPPFEEDSALQE
jgi:hypothetical protein